MSPLCVNCGADATSNFIPCPVVAPNCPNPRDSLGKEENVTISSDSDESTNISVSKMISLVFKIDVFNNFCDSCFMCSNCITSLKTVYLFKLKLLRSTVDKSLLSNLVLARQGTSVPLQNMKNETGSGDCSKVCAESILPDQEENVHQPKHNHSENSSKTTKTPVVLKELFVRLEVKKLSKDQLISGSKDFYNTSDDKRRATLKRKANQAKQTKQSTSTTKTSSSQLVTCTKCFRIFPNELLMKNHFAAAHETNEQKLCCTFCSAKFSSRWFFKYHLKTCHEGVEILYACKICTISFYCDADLQEHNKTTHRKYPFGCNHCMESFNVIEELRTHLIASHEKSKETAMALSNMKELERLEDLKKCEVSGQSLHSVSQMQQHRSSAHGVSAFTCDICDDDKIFDSPSKLKQHLRKHTKCEKCGKSFTESIRLKSHIENMHWTTQPFGCEMCGFRRPNFRSLFIHYRYHREKCGPKLFCNICNKSYFLKGQLVIHMKLYHPSESLQIPCEECGMIFSSRFSLNEHLETVHKLSGDFACSKCDRTFLHEKSFSSHMLQHSKEYQYRPSQQEVVTENNRVETTSCFSEETALFTCPVCGKTMEWKNHLLRHLRVHKLNGYTDIAKESEIKRTIKCTYTDCKKMFTRKDTLSRHIQSHHVATQKVTKKGIYSDCKVCGLHLEGDHVHLKRFHEQLHNVKIILASGEKMDLTAFYNDKRKEYKCSLCSTRVFYSQQQAEFVIHMEKFHKSKILTQDLTKNYRLLRVTCKKCKKRFTTNFQLKRHEKEQVCGKNRLRIRKEHS